MDTETLSNGVGLDSVSTDCSTVEEVSVLLDNGYALEQTSNSNSGPKDCS